MIKPKLHFQRFEFKYYLPKSTADKIIPALLNYMDWDPYIAGSGRDYYQVNSLYFDSPDYGCFWDKESGIADRKKLRYRYYNDLHSGDDAVFVEIKRKKDALVIKDRVKFDVASCSNNLFDNKLRDMRLVDKKNDFLEEIIWFKNRNSMKPKLFVTYRRKALVGKIDKRFRVTLDHDIRTQKLSDLHNQLGKLESVYPEGVVLELKYNNVLPKWFQEIIQKYQLQRLAYSKYCNSLRVAMPQFDDNNYSVV